MIGDSTSPQTPSLAAAAMGARLRAQPIEQRAVPANPESLKELRKAIYRGHLIVGSDNGSWTRRSRIAQVVFEVLDFLFGTEFVKQHNLQLATFFENYMKSFEVKSSKFLKGIALEKRKPNDPLIERAKEAIIRRLRDHELIEERTIRVTEKREDGTKVIRTLQELIDERKVIKNHIKLHLRKEEVLKASNREVFEEKLFHLDTLIRNGRAGAFASLGIHRLERQAIAMMYRERTQDKIYRKKPAFKEAQKMNVRWMEKDLRDWKREALEKKDKVTKKTVPTPHVREDLTEKEKEKINLTSFFPKFVALLKEDPQLREEYYKFVFRNTADGGHDAPDIAIQLPVHQKMLMKCILDKREGRFHDLFKLETREFHEEGESRSGLRKFVSVKVEGEFYDPFDGKKTIEFDKGTPYKVTRSVKEVFTSFGKKNVVMGEYETTESRGITRLHGPLNSEFGMPYEEVSTLQRISRAISGLFSSHVPTLPPCIDLHQEDWMKGMKPFETISKSKVAARYGVDPAHALIVARATRQQPLDERETVMINESHSFLELVVPNGKMSVSEEGRGKKSRPEPLFDIYPIGKYAFPWPNGTLDTLLYIFNTQRGIIRIDENSFYNHRHQAAFSMQATPEQVKRFWEKIRRDLFKERNNEIIFQAQGDNCSIWAEETLDYAFDDPNRPRLYEVSYLQGSGPSPISYILDFLQFLATTISETVANIARILISFTFGAWRGYTTGPEGEGPTHRLITNPTWRDQKLMLPGVLFKRCLNDSEENMKGYFQLKVGHAS